MMPAVSLSRSQDTYSTSRSGGSSKGTYSRGSHSHSNSLSKTLSKSSKSHSHSHSRTDSWGKSALKVAKSAACGMTGADVFADAPADTLEGALKRDDTKVIRLADPAYIPVDKGLAVDSPIAASVSPVPSASSDVMVGIALSTPPSEDADAIRLPGHPYAKAGLYHYRTHVSSTDSRTEQHGSDYAGPHPSLTVSQSSTNDVSSRHRIPPFPIHPYARSSRDSFFDDPLLIPQPRLDSDVPPPAKMWARWSPGVVREILPSEIQYSPFLPGNSALNSRSISDTMGTGVVRPQRSKDSGLGTSEDNTVVTERESGHRQAVSVAKRSHRQPVQYDATRPSYLTSSHRPSDPSSSHTVASSSHVPSKPLDPQNTTLDDPHPISASPVTTSASSSSLRPFGNPDDLDNYHDLFYQPRRSKENLKNASDEPVASTSVAWEDRLDPSGSGLAGLARQLSQEFHQMAAEHDRDSYYSRASMAGSQHSAFFRRPTDSGLELVFEEVSQSESVDDATPPDTSSLAAFHPSDNIPEDVSRSSVQLDPEEDEDETGEY